jgi:heptaprenyl diphosphate synthase
MSINLLKNFSIYGTSVLGALTHNLTQLTIVYFLFIPQKTIFNILPIVLILSIVTGNVTGFLTKKILNKISHMAEPAI